MLLTGSEDSARRTIQQLNAACNWALDRGEIQSNPFGCLQIKVKKKKPRIDPFSSDERDRIIREFERNPHHQHYANYVKFLFLTGCRPSEAIGLTWGDIQGASIKLWSPVVEGDRLDSLKNGDIRFFPINHQLRALLDQVGHREPHQPVFLSIEGAIVNGRNFLERHWKPVLEILKIRYRKAYNTRHTFVTICLIKGEKPETVARWIGDNPITMMKYYAGFIPADVPIL